MKEIFLKNLSFCAKLLLLFNLAQGLRKKNFHLVLGCTGGKVFFIFFNAKNQENSK